MAGHKGTPTPKREAARKRGRNWSHQVMETSNALDLERDIFTSNDPVVIARSLKRSAEQSERRKSSPFRSAMSMLTFYVNRGGTNLSQRRRRVLERAKDELRAAFGRDIPSRGGAKGK